MFDQSKLISEIKRGHAAGDSDLEKQASQLASDIRYKSKGKLRPGANREELKKIYVSLLASSPAPGPVKSMAKKKLLGESVTEDKAYANVLKKLKAQYGSNAVIGTGETIKDTRSEKSKVKAQRKRAASDEKERRFKQRNPAVTSGRYPKDDEKAWAAAREREKREGIGEGALADRLRSNLSDKKKKWDKQGEEHKKWVKDADKEVAAINKEFDRLKRYDEIGEAKVDTGDDVQKEKTRNERKFGKQTFNQYGQTLTRRGLHRSNRGEKKRKGEKVEEGKLVHGPYGPYITDQKMPRENQKPLTRVPYEQLIPTKQKEEALINSAVEYFYNEGINEDGLDIIIEELGLDNFVEFISESVVELNEERSARKMNVRTKKTVKKEAERIKSDKSDVVSRKTSPKDTLQRVAASKALKKRKFQKPPQKEVSGKDTSIDLKKEKVKKAVSKAKTTQPKKPASKKGIRGAISRGIERHKKAVSKSEFAKGVVSGVKAVGKAAKDVKSVLDANKDKTVNMQSYEPEGDFIGEKIQVGKASPKSPNCIIMPTKDEISDKAKKKTLTGVVTKKQKQLLNQEGRSNWREEFNSPRAVQININRFSSEVDEPEQLDEFLGQLAGTALKVGGAAAKSAVKATGSAVKAGATSVAKTGSVSKSLGNLAKSGIDKAGQKVMVSRAQQKLRPGIAARNPNVSSRLVDKLTTKKGTQNWDAFKKKTEPYRKAASTIGSSIGSSIKQGAVSKPVGHRRAPT